MLHPSLSWEAVLTEDAESWLTPAAIHHGRAFVARLNDHWTYEALIDDAPHQALDSRLRDLGFAAEGSSYASWRVFFLAVARTTDQTAHTVTRARCEVTGSVTEVPTESRGILGRIFGSVLRRARLQ